MRAATLGAAAQHYVNLAINPRGGAGSSPNSAATSVAWEEVAGPPGMGLVMARASTANSGPDVLSLYNVGGSGNNPTVRGMGVWVRVNQPGYMASASPAAANAVPIPQNEWVFINEPGLRSGWAQAYVRTRDLTRPAPDAKAWAVGAIQIEGRPVTGPHQYIDGTMYGCAWLGAPNNSRTVGRREE